MNRFHSRQMRRLKNKKEYKVLYHFEGNEDVDWSLMKKDVIELIHKVTLKRSFGLHFFSVFPMLKNVKVMDIGKEFTLLEEEKLKILSIDFPSVECLVLMPQSSQILLRNNSIKKSLRKLKVNVLNQKSIATIANCTNIEELTINSVNPTINNVDKLQNLSIKVLDTSVDHEDLLNALISPELVKLKSYVEISPVLLKSGIHLQEIHLSCCNLMDEDLRFIKNCGLLRVLRLDYNNFTHRIPLHQIPTTNLEELLLQFNPLQRIDFLETIPFPNLRVLNIQNTQLLDDALTVLSKLDLPKLRRLSAAWNSFNSNACCKFLLNPKWIDLHLCEVWNEGKKSKWTLFP